MYRFSIQTKITLPFMLLFAIIIFAIPIITISLFNRKYDEQFSVETKEWLEAIVQTNYIYEPEKVKRAYRAEVVVFGQDGSIKSSTITNQTNSLPQLAAELKVHQIQKQLKGESGDEFMLKNVTVFSKPYKAIYYLQSDGRLYCLIRPIDKIAEAKRQAILLMIGVASSGVFLVICISYLIGNNLSKPISNLVAFTHRVANGNLDIQCELTTQDEIGNLTTSFNQMTTDLRNSRDELIQVERLAMAGKMAASFAHEIRNPLSSMRMLAQMLLRPSLTEETRHQSQQYILEEIERIDLIVKGLMDFAKPEKLIRSKCDLQCVLQEITNLMEANLQHHNISLTKDYDSSIEPVLLDYDKIKQVIINLLLNAIESQPSNGEIEISTKKHEGQVYICVSDNGIGISPSNLESVFEPFFTTKLEGTGLGLANSKRIIDQHGGKMRIESILGKGTQVTIEIPIESKTSQEENGKSS